MKAIPLGILHGKPVFRFPVKITFGETAARHQVMDYPSGVVHVISHAARDARDFVTDALQFTPCVEVEVYGVRGGIAAHSYRGWDSAIYAGMLREAASRSQLRLPLD